MPLNDLERELAEKSVWPAERLVKYLITDHETFLVKRLPRMKELTAGSGRRKPGGQFYRKNESLMMYGGQRT